LLDEAQGGEHGSGCTGNVDRADLDGGLVRAGHDDRARHGSWHDAGSNGRRHRRYWWTILVLLVIAAAIWYFMRGRNRV